MFLHGDAAPVIFYDDRTIGVDNNGDGVGDTRHDFVDAVIDDFLDEMVQTTLICGADIHAGAYTHGLQAFENLDVLFAVAAVAVYEGFPVPRSHCHAYFRYRRE